MHAQRQLGAVTKEKRGTNYLNTGEAKTIKNPQYLSVTHKHECGEEYAGGRKNSTNTNIHG